MRQGPRPPSAGTRIVAALLAVALLLAQSGAASAQTFRSRAGASPSPWASVLARTLGQAPEGARVDPLLVSLRDRLALGGEPALEPLARQLAARALTPEAFHALPLEERLNALNSAAPEAADQARRDVAGWIAEQTAAGGRKGSARLESALRRLAPYLDPATRAAAEASRRAASGRRYAAIRARAAAAASALGADAAEGVATAPELRAAPLPELPPSPRTQGASWLETADAGVDGAALARELAPTFDALPEDPFRAAAPGRRFRAVAVLDFPAGPDGTLGKPLSAPGAAFATLDGAASYPGIAPQVLEHPGLQALIRAAVERLPASDRRHGVRVGLHQMRAAGGAVTPEGLHQDDQARYVAMWAVSRRGEGGVSRVARDPQGRDVAVEEALGPGRLLLVDNRALWHEVTPLAPDATRDVFVLALSPLEPAALLAPARRRALAARARAEFDREAPDAERLRAIYRRADTGLRAQLLRLFRRWSRYLAPSRGPDWSFLKAAAAPWAGHVYLPRMESFLERLQRTRRNASLRGKDVRAEARKIHAADHAFAKAFVAAAERERPDELDAEEAAERISDEVIYRMLMEPVLQERGLRSLEPEELLPELAKRLKASVYLLDDAVTEDSLLALLRADERVRARWSELVNAVAPYAAKAPAPEREAGTEASREESGSLSRVVRSAVVWAMLSVASLGALPAALDDDGSAAASAPAIARSLALTRPPSEGGKGAPEGLPEFLTDLTQAAARGELGEVHLRDQEEAALTRILSQTRNGIAYLLGEPGVGKTAIVEALAQRIARKETGTRLDDYRILSLDIGKFLAEAGRSPAAFSQATAKVLETVSDDRTLLFIDEAHQLKGSSMPGASFFDQLKPAMARGKVKLVAATTREEYRRSFAKDDALTSRGDVLEVLPISETAATATLYRLKRIYEDGVEVTYDAARAAVEMTVRAYRFQALMRMAEKALDAAATLVRVREGQARMQMAALRRDLEHYLSDLRAARAAGERSRARDAAALAGEVLDRYAKARADLASSMNRTVTPADVARALVEKGAPVHLVNAGTKEHLDDTRAFLNKHLIGREGLVERTVSAIARRFANPRSRKPIFSVLLPGATGSGKTEFVRLLSKSLLGVSDFEKSVYKIDGGKLKEEHRKTEILGAPPSYVGYGETRTLADHVRENPSTIVLIDEVEKMHPSILDIFLSILEDGALKDSKGKPVDFSNVIVAFTSNFGVPDDFDRRTAKEIESAVREALRGPYQPVAGAYGFNPFRPEFLNRLDLIEVTPPLTREEAARIVRLRLDQARERWSVEHGVELVYEAEGKLNDAVVTAGYNVRDGARGLNRALQDRVETPLSDALVERRLQSGQRAVLEVAGTVRVEEGARSGVETIEAFGRTAEGRRLAAALESLLGTLETGAPLPAPALDAVLGAARPTAPPLPWALSEPASGPDLRRHKPGAKDPALAETLRAVAASLGARKDAEAVLRAVRALLQTGKGLNLEEAAARIGGDAAAGFSRLEREAKAKGGGAPLAALRETVAKADAELTARAEWNAEAGGLRLIVRTGAALTSAAEAWLNARFSGSSETSEDAALTNAKRAAEAAGGRLGWGVAEGRVALHLEWPAARSKRRAAAEAVPARQAPPRLPALRDPGAPTTPKPRPLDLSTTDDDDPRAPSGPPPDPRPRARRKPVETFIDEAAEAHKLARLRDGLESPESITADDERALAEPVIIALDQSVDAESGHYDVSAFENKGERPHRIAQEYVDLYVRLAELRPDIVSDAVVQAWLRLMRIEGREERGGTPWFGATRWLKSRMVSVFTTTRGRGITPEEAMRALQNLSKLKVLTNLSSILPLSIIGAVPSIVTLSILRDTGYNPILAHKLFGWFYSSYPAFLEDYSRMAYVIPLFALLAQFYGFGLWLFRDHAMHREMTEQWRLAARLARGISIAYEGRDVRRLALAATETRGNGRRRVRHGYRLSTLLLSRKFPAFRDEVRRLLAGGAAH